MPLASLNASLNLVAGATKRAWRVHSAFTVEAYKVLPLCTHGFHSTVFGRDSSGASCRWELCMAPGAVPDSRDISGCTTLMHAAKNGHEDNDFKNERPWAWRIACAMQQCNDAI